MRVACVRAVVFGPGWERAYSGFGQARGGVVRRVWFLGVLLGTSMVRKRLGFRSRVLFRFGASLMIPAQKVTNKCRTSPPLSHSSYRSIPTLTTLCSASVSYNIHGRVRGPAARARVRYLQADKAAGEWLIRKGLLGARGGDGAGVGGQADRPRRPLPAGTGRRHAVGQNTGAPAPSEHRQVQGGLPHRQGQAQHRHGVRRGRRPIAKN